MKKICSIIATLLAVVLFANPASAASKPVEIYNDDGVSIKVWLESIEDHAAQVRISWEPGDAMESITLPNYQPWFSNPAPYEIRNNGEYPMVINGKKATISMYLMGNREGYSIEDDDSLNNETFAQLMDMSRDCSGIATTFLDTCLDGIMERYRENGSLPEFTKLRSDLAEHGESKGILSFIISNAGATFSDDFNNNILLGILSGDVSVDGIAMSDLNSGMQRLIFELFFITVLGSSSDPSTLDRKKAYVDEARSLMSEDITSYIYSKYRPLLGEDNTERQQNSNNSFVSWSQEFDGIKYFGGPSFDGVQVCAVNGQDVGMVNEYGPGADDGSTFVIEPIYDGQPVTGIPDEGFNWFGKSQVILPESIKSIGKRAFSNNWRLQSITLPKALNSLGEGVFDQCNSLKSIEVAPGNERYRSISGVLVDLKEKRLIKYPAYKEDTTYQVPEGIETIASHAFESVAHLETLQIPDSVKVIEDEAITGCLALKHIDMGAGVAKVGRAAFFDNWNLSEATLGDGVAQCSAGVFERTSVSSIRVPNSLTDLESGLFASDAFITEYVVDSANETFTALDGVLFTKDMKTLVAFPPNKPITEYSIPQGVETINAGAFSWAGKLSNQGGLRSVRIPGSVQCIERGAFKESFIKTVVFEQGLLSVESEAFSLCDELQAIELPEGVTYVGPGAFSLCYQLGRVSLPASLQSVGSNAFSADEALTEVRFAGSEAPEGLNASTFDSSRPTIYGIETSDIEAFAANCGLPFSPTAGKGGVPVGLKYDIKNGKAIITQYTGNASEVDIPERIEGVPTSEIGDWAFYGVTGLYKVTLPNGLERIGSLAFANCSDLEMVELNSNPEIADDAFSGCSESLNITIPE